MRSIPLQNLDFGFFFFSLPYRTLLTMICALFVHPHLIDLISLLLFLVILHLVVLYAFSFFFGAVAVVVVQ